MIAILTAIVTGIWAFSAPASAQPVSAPLQGGLRPMLGEDDTLPRRDTPRAQPPRRAAPPPAGTTPNLDGSDAASPAFGNPAGSGAGRTGFVSTNIKRLTPDRRTVRRAPAKFGSKLGAAPTTTTSTAAMPLSITPGTTMPTLGATPTTAASNATTPTAAPAPTPAAAPPRNPLLRIPDGTTTGGTAGTVNTANLPAATTTLLRRRTAVEDDPFAPLGLRLGSFVVSPALETTGGFDSNPARVPNGKSSLFTVIAPEVAAKSDWTRHEVTATLRGSYTAYDKTPELDRPTVDGKVTGRLDVTHNTALIGEGTLVVGTDNPGSPNVQAGLSRFPIYTTLGAAGGITQRFNRLEITAKGLAERTEYQDSHFTDGTTESNNDRNYDRFGGSLRASYDVVPGLKPFVEVSADTREHDLPVDHFGVERDSTGWIAKAGSTVQFTRLLTGEFALGWIERKYKDPTLPELSGFLFDGSLIYALSALTNVKLTASTVAAETTVPGTAGVLTRNAGVELEHAFRRWLIGSVKFNYGNDDYVGSLRNDNRYALSASIVYKLNRWAQVKAEVREEWLRSSTPVGVNYDATVFLLGMKLTP
ncbi:MAG: outer membrane beta-barrel protein [Alphaproteobacteria bacterium]|nr:outer membrane beta-barrel protein [Alphaproteobacteria bacterium]